MRVRLGLGRRIAMPLGLPLSISRRHMHRGDGALRHLGVFALLKRRPVPEYWKYGALLYYTISVFLAILSLSLSTFSHRRRGADNRSLHNHCHHRGDSGRSNRLWSNIELRIRGRHCRSSHHRTYLHRPCSSRSRSNISLSSSIRLPWF